MVAQARADLIETAAARGLPLGEHAAHSPLLERCHGESCEQLLSEIEGRAERLRERMRQKRALPAIDEWLEWAALARRLERAFFLGGSRVRDGAFPTLHSHVTAYAVWLYNQRGLHHLAHGIFRYLLAEARRMNDPSAIALQAKNARVRPW